MTDRMLFFCDSAGEREILRGEMSDHPERVVAESVAITENLQAQWRLREADLDALYQRCETALERWMTDLRAYADRLPSTPSTFRPKAGSNEMKLICRMIVSLRDGLDELRELVTALREAEENLNVYRVHLTDTEQMLSLLRGEANDNLQPRVAGLQADAVGLKSALADSASTLQTLSREWLSFTAVTVPDFLKRVSADADFLHNGEQCSIPSVCSRCGELRFAAERLARLFSAWCGKA